MKSAEELEDRSSKDAAFQLREQGATAFLKDLNERWEACDGDKKCMARELARSGLDNFRQALEERQVEVQHASDGYGDRGDNDNAGSCHVM